MLAAHTTQFWRSRRLQGRRPAAFFTALVVYIIVILVAAPQAQQPQVFNPTGTASATVVRDAVSGSEIDLMVGRSTVLNVGANIARVSLTVPDIADALVTAPSQLLIHGKKPGTISLFVWDKAGAISTFEVKVRHDLSALLDAPQAALPRRRHHRTRQRQGHRHLRHRLEQVRDREGRGHGRRLRRQEGRRRQHAEAAGGRGVEPGDAARALRRGQPLRDAGARRVHVRPWFRVERPVVRPDAILERGAGVQ